MFRRQTIITVKSEQEDWRGNDTEREDIERKDRNNFKCQLTFYCDTAFKLLFYITNCTYSHANFRSFDKLSKLFILGTSVCFYPKL
uniref:Uncharacterized protein n=1 Tax=Manihot esculenta TaxID=3983 RepID=A0A199UA71_MANES